MQIASFLVWKLLLTIAVFVAIAYLSICLALLVWQNRLIFFPSREIETTPADLGLSYQEVWIPVSTKTGKVERLHGWWIPSTSPATGVLLYLHGNGSNIGGNVNQAQRLQQLGFSVLLVDYRGYGRSEGNFPTESQVYQDAEAAWNYLVQERGIAPEEIFIYGHSLGGAIAINLAAQTPQTPGLIVESTFTSLRDMVDHEGIYRLFPADLLLTHKFDSIAKVKSLTMPILLIHGTHDLTVPSVMSQILFDTITAPKELVFVPGAGHNNVAAVAGLHYQQAVQEFLHQVRVRQGTGLDIIDVRRHL
ncbi:MAG TPA: phospholipase [Cyanobacteria bacterium UBA8803]|nr:phospholipase [Cyanobacteria bacterium UBA9273]HBL59692.1 phospholipase [Cyanobacteria bacterium UBA8803]